MFLTCARGNFLRKESKSIRGRRLISEDLWGTGEGSKIFIKIQNNYNFKQNLSSFAKIFIFTKVLQKFLYCCQNFGKLRTYQIFPEIWQLAHFWKINNFPYFTGYSPMCAKVPRFSLGVL